MSDITGPSAPRPDHAPRSDSAGRAKARPYDSRDIAKNVYALYLAGFFIPLCALAGLVLAYVKRGEADAVAASHFEFQIRSFWIGLAACVLGGLLAIVLVGYALLALWVIWALVRFITGLLAIVDGRAVRDPEGFGFTA